MRNRDEVIRQCARATENHALCVGRALRGVLSAEDEVMRAFAERRLRDELVALSTGYDGCSNGSTYAARVAAAKAALDAWD